MTFAKAGLALAPKASAKASPALAKKGDICVQYRSRLWVQAGLEFPNVDTDSKKMPETAFKSSCT